MTEAERLKVVRRALIKEGYTPDDVQRAILKREGHWIVYLDGERIGIYDFMRGAFID